MTIEHYITLLGQHDWAFEYSDDHRVWTHWKANERYLLSLAKIHGEEFMNEFQKRKMNGNQNNIS